MAQGKRKANYGMDAGAKYDLPGKKASLSLNVRDVFNSKKYGAVTGDATTITEFLRRMRGPMANLTFSYRFGQTTFVKKSKKPEQQEQQSPDEGTF